VAVGVYIGGFAALLLWLSGDWHWVEGWIFGVWRAAGPLKPGFGLSGAALKSSMFAHHSKAA